MEKGADSRLTIAINAIGDLMDALVEKGITATVTVVTFASSANTLASVNGKTVANQTDADAVKSALTNVTASGGTYMNNGLKKAEEEFKTDTTAQQVLIMLADGDYNGTNPYPTDGECAAKRMEEAAIDIYTIAFTTDIDVMAEIAANNGKYSTASDKTALDSIFSSIANYMTA